MTTTPGPWIATDAPMIEKISAWLEEEGSPKYQVTRSQMIAEISAATTRSCVTTLASTMPVADGLGDGHAGERADQVERAGHDHGLPRREHASRHDGRDRVRRVMEAVDVLEVDAEDDDEREQEVARYPSSFASSCV